MALVINRRIIMEIGTYLNPEKVGYRGWIKTDDGLYFVALDGKITKPIM
jgi:hypothetical protein